MRTFRSLFFSTILASLLSLGASAEEQYTITPRATAAPTAEPAIPANTVTRVEGSPFSGAYFMIAGDAYMTTDFTAAGQKDALRGYTNPPGVVVVCFRDLVKDPLKGYAEDGWESCREWELVSWTIPNPGVRQDGMTLSYTRRGFSSDITQVNLSVPSETDYDRWDEVARKARARYEEAFAMQRRDLDQDKARTLERENVRKELLQKLRKKPIMVYPK